MSWLVSAKQYIPAVIGEPFGGGYFAGYISHTADGNPTHALIVAPRATGATGVGYTLNTNIAWKTADTTTSALIDGVLTSADSPFDGRLNTDVMIAAGINDHPAAQFCVNLSIGGFTDWYFPSRYELDIAYFNLKPTTIANNTSWGTNVYAVPQRNSNWMANYPAQTSLTAFNTSAESFAANSSWSSTEDSASKAWNYNFATGTMRNDVNKTSADRVRAFRRITL